MVQVIGHEDPIRQGGASHNSVHACEYDGLTKMYCVARSSSHMLPLCWQTMPP
jgi:hypothetical protein